MPTYAEAAVERVGHTGSDQGAAADAEPVFRADPTVFGPLTHSRAEATRQVAADQCCTGARYAHLGRGPLAYDDFGFVRMCVQAALDWEAWDRGARRGADSYVITQAAIDDLHYAPGKLDANDAAAFLAAQGLVRVACQNASKEARPGDVLVYLGPGPRLGVVMAPWRTTGRFPDFDPPAVALVWEGEPPKTDRQARMAWMPVSLYRWPEAAR